MKKLMQKVSAIGMVVFLAAGAAVQAAPLYDNSSTDTGYSLNFTNGWTLGNQIVFGGGISSALVTNFSFEIYSTLATFAGPNVQMQVFLYSNDGTPFNGYSTPFSTYYDSGLFTLYTPQEYATLFSLPASDAVKLIFDLSSSPVPVNTDFTLGIRVTGLASTDTVGLELFGPAGYGLNYGDYWANNNGGGWVLMTNAVPTSFGAEFSGTVPEPSVLYLGAVGATLLTGLTWLRRRQDASKQN